MFMMAFMTPFYDAYIVISLTLEYQILDFTNVRSSLSGIYETTHERIDCSLKYENQIFPSYLYSKYFVRILFHLIRNLSNMQFFNRKY